MVVDDQELNQAFLQMMLEGMGVETICVSDGHSAVELFETKCEGFECILMDIMMPELNGFETCRMIRRSRKKNADTIPVIAVSANAYSDTGTGAILSGMNDLLL